MKSFKYFYFKNNQKKIVSLSKKKKNSPPPFLFPFPLSLLNFFLKKQPKKKYLKKYLKQELEKKLEKNLTFPIKSSYQSSSRSSSSSPAKFNILVTVFFLFLIALTIPLFSLIVSLDELGEKITFPEIAPKPDLVEKKDQLPYIEIVEEDGSIKQRLDKKYAQNDFEEKIENLESPNDFIDNEKIGDLLDEESVPVEEDVSNPLLLKQETKEAKDLVEEVKRVVRYVIKKGDNLWSLSRKNGISIDSIISLNKIKTPHDLRIGKVIKIPKFSGIYYQVKKNDSLYEIANRYSTKVEEIKKYNQISPYLVPGQNIFLPRAKLTSKERKDIFGKLFIKPVGGILTSKYGMRFHPIKKKWLFHTGIDIGQNENQSVKSLADGTVVYSGEKGNYGKYVKIKHADGYVSAYGHLDKIFVREGQRVRQGKAIATVGNTGLSTGPHLHLEIKHNGKFINPRRFIKFR